MSPARAALLGALALAVGALGVRGGDPVAAAALWRAAVAQAGEDFTDPIYVDAARGLGRVRPWQAGYREARTRRARIEAGRRAALAP